MNGWFFWNDANDTFGGAGSLAAGPATPPIGAGSVKLPTVLSSEAPSIATTSYDGTPLSAITSIQYRTFRVAPTAAVFAITLQFDVDFDSADANNGFQGRMVWEPSVAGLATPANTWSSWNPMTASSGWYFTRAPGSTSCKFNNAAAACSWAKVRQLFPRASIQGRVLLKAGSNWANFNGSADALTLGISGVDSTWNFDTRGPVLTASATSNGNPYTSGAWANHDVVVHWSCAVASGVTTTVTPDATVSAEGAGQSRTGTCTDSDGNTTSATFSNINIDKSPPVITPTRAPAANGNGWNSTNVTVSFSCDATISGQASLTAPITVTEGANQSATGTCVDKAGNSASTTVDHINVDTSAPNISATRTPAANANGWNNSDVTVSFSCDASISGQDSLTAPVTLGEGANQSATGTCVDNAGNTASKTVDHINVDETAPIITASRTPPANANGWNKTNVTVSFTCNATISGQDSLTAPVSVGDGTDQSVTGTCVDKAGNTASATVDHINVDTTAPVITASRTPAANASGWNNSDVTVSFSCDASISGQDSLTAPATLGEGANQSATGTCVDRAGNSASTTVDHINVDETAPIITGTRTPAANAHGWNNTNVTVSFSCDATISGQDSLTGPITVGEGTDQSATGTCVDKAGNSASATVDHINVDKTAPDITATRAPAANGFGWNNTDVTVSFSCDASISGQDSLTAPVTLGEGASQSVTGTCKDNAGNSASKTVSAINVDETAPVLGACPSGGPFAYGTGSHTVGPIGYDAGISGLDTAGSSLTALVSTSTPGSVTVAFTAIDRAGNATTRSCSYGVGIREAKQAVLTTIQSALTSANKRDADRLREAAQRIGDSLSAELWTDDNHLDAKRGKRVFELEKQAVQKLLELQGDKKTVVSGTLLQGWIDALTGVDRELAVEALAAAQADPGADASKTAEAARELAKGDEAVGDHTTAAIEHYGQAWDKAQDAH